jgi:hypothetical protein
MKRSCRSPAALLLLLSLCLALVLPAAAAAQGWRAPEPGIWSTVVAGLDAATQAVRSFWSGLLLPKPPPAHPNGDNASCLDPDGRPMPCKPNR